MKWIVICVCLLLASPSLAQSINGSPPLPLPVLPSDRIFIFRGTFPAYQTTIGALLSGSQGISGQPLLTSPPTNAALKSMIGMVQNAVVYRAGFYAPGDGGGAFYVFSTTNCTLVGGAGDNASQVAPTAGGGCWNISK